VTALSLSRRDLLDAGRGVTERLAAVAFALPVGATCELRLRHDPDEAGWARLLDLVEGAGFVLDPPPTASARSIPAIRTWSLPDRVRTGLTVLVCGSNPSPASSNAGVGYARPGNRFWPAALAAGLVEHDRDPTEALAGGMGMTDLVKRTTVRADDLSAEENRVGLARVERLAAWFEPAVVCFVGLAGWRAAVDRRAVAGPQHHPIGRSAVYLMPSTSGLNAHEDVVSLARHLRAARSLAERAERA